jgi:hypothetical protein
MLAAALGFGPTALAQPIPLPPAPAGVEVTREAGFEFVTVRAPNATGYPNPTFTWTGVNPWQEYQGRGAATHPYRISRTEMTTGQWMSFLNAFAGQARPSNVSPTVYTSIVNTFYGGPFRWGGQVQSENFPNLPTWTTRASPNANAAPVLSIGISEQSRSRVV